MWLKQVEFPWTVLFPKTKFAKAGPTRFSPTHPGFWCRFHVWVHDQHPIRIVPFRALFTNPAGDLIYLIYWFTCTYVTWHVAMGEQKIADLHLMGLLLQSTSTWSGTLPLATISILRWKTHPDGCNDTWVILAGVFFSYVFKMGKMNPFWLTPCRDGWFNHQLDRLDGVNSNIFYFHPEPRGKWSKLTSIVFKWVETTTN